MGKSSRIKKAADTGIRFFKTNLDEILILSSFSAIKYGGEPTEHDPVVLAAFSRYSKETQDLESVRDYLSGLSDEQVAGVVPNIKGIVHEMEFVNLENSDGDSVTAALFPESNHKGFDLVLTDNATGDSWEVQLKTTDSSDYIQQWIDKYPEGEILVSEEIASEMGLPSSGFSNEEITVKVETFVDGLISARPDSKAFDLFSSLPLVSVAFTVSVAFVVVELHKRFKTGEIDRKQFMDMVMRTTGIKAGKFGLLMVALSIPVINIVVGAGLVAKLLISLSDLWTISRHDPHTPGPATVLPSPNQP